MHPTENSTAQWLAAIGTCAAVLVALFGPSLRQWWKRPRLSLQRDPIFGSNVDGLIFAKDSDRSKVSIVTLVVTNHGRGQAEDVEAILTAQQRFGPDSSETAEIPGIEFPVVSRGALQWELGHSGDARIDIPPRSARTLQLVMLGTDEQIRKELTERSEEAPSEEHEVFGLFCVRPVKHSDMYTALPNDEAIGIEIQLQGRNVQASTWRSRVRASAWQYVDDEAPLTGISLTWMESIKKRGPSILPTPLRARIGRSTPWARWNHHRFEKELGRIQEEAE